MVETNINLTTYETYFPLTQLTECKISKNLAAAFERELEQGYLLEADLGFKFFEFLIIHVKNYFLN